MEHATATTQRSRAKADRRAALLAAAARLFAERGFERVTLEEIGGAAGISGPAVYRHFAEQAGRARRDPASMRARGCSPAGSAVVEREPDAAAALRELVAFHVDFAVANAPVIRVQDRDLDSLADADQSTVRTLQRDLRRALGRPARAARPVGRRRRSCARAPMPDSGS